MNRILFATPIGNSCRLTICTAIITTLLLVGALTPGRSARAMMTTLVQSFEVTGGTPTPTDNDYTRINNAVLAASSGDTIQLDGNFD
ncbi:MAG TPA: hypothetical protein VFV34_26275, partial [Blastocatellia bacterium]|nr:hypothetical protein [Blastocatellia bacterium]